MQDIPFLVQKDANGDCLCPALSNLPLFKSEEFLLWAKELISTTATLQSPPAPLRTEDFVSAVVPFISELELRMERDQRRLKLQMERNQNELKYEMAEMRKLLISSLQGRNDGLFLLPA